METGKTGYELLRLLPQHEKLIAESGIALEVAVARGYRSVEKKCDMRALGFKDYQCRIPALLVPVWSVAGEKGTYQARPDDPRIKKGKGVKYETPGDTCLVLDVHPTARQWIGDPGRPLFITEGVRKADAAVSRGLCCIALLGVWNWRGSNEHGGKVALPDWESIALNGRQVYICFDSDVKTNPQVRQAMSRLKAFLEHRGARVQMIYLPPGEGGVKVGLDDYLAVGYSVEELLSLTETAPDGVNILEEAMTCEIVDGSPDAIRRPLCIVGDHAYAATWSWVRTTVRQTVDKSGNIEVHNPPLVRNEKVLVIVRDDGKLFARGGVPGAEPLSELGVEVTLSEAPPDNRIWSGLGLKRYLAGGRPDPKDIFRKACDVVGTFMDFRRSLAGQQEMCEMVGCYVLATYLLDAFNVIGYLWPSGDRGCGKTHFLFTVAEMACLGQVILAGGSYASLRDLADYGATLAFDDAEGIMDIKRVDPDKRALLLAGNRRGTTISLKEPAGQRGWVTRHIQAFCPRLFSAIRLPDEVLASRSIIVPLVRCSDPKRANADPLDHPAWPHDCSRLRDDLWAMGLANLRKVWEYDRIVADQAKLSGRNLQPWRAILAVALWLDKACGVSGLFERMEALSVTYQTERDELETSDPTRIAILALWEMVTDRQSEELSFGTSELTERMNNLAIRYEIAGDGEDYFKPKRVGWLLKRLRFEKETPTRNARRWKTKLSDIQVLARSYGMTLATGENADNAENVENADDVSTFSTFSTFDGEASGEGDEMAPESSERDESGLAERIREALSGKLLPVEVAPGQFVQDVGLYAAREAQAALNQSPAVSVPARQRLQRLGVAVTGASDER